MLKWLLLDLNSFFASCEQQEDPSIRGRPVAVVPSLTDSTSVIAASYEAKAFGIKTNTKVGDAKRMCPNLVLKTGNHKLYTEYHHRIIKACEEVLPIKKVLSIDEVACELLGKEREPSEALKIAQNMKDHVRKTVGSEIKSSVGIAPNILLAKIASDMQKPDGLVMIEKHQIRDKIGRLPIEAIPGIGPQTKYKFNSKGIFKIEDLLGLSEQELKTKWGNIWGLRTALELKGEDLAWRSQTHQKSLSHEHVLPPKFRNPENAFHVLQKLTAKGASRLREENFKCRRFSFYVKFRDGTRFESSITFNESDDTHFFSEQLKLNYKVGSDKKPIKVGLAFSDLSAGSNQLSFFDDPKRTNINAALDQINQKWGPNTLFTASTKPVLSSAKTRISFNHIPRLKDEFDEGS